MNTSLVPDDAPFWARELAEWKLDPAGYEQTIVEGLVALEALRRELPDDAEQDRRVLSADIALFREIQARMRDWKATL